MTIVKVNHSGNVIDHENGTRFHFVKNVPVALPDEVLEALGEDSYIVVSEEDEKPLYQDLQARAKELGLPTKGKYKELEELIAKKEAEQEKGEERIITHE